MRNIWATVAALLVASVSLTCSKIASAQTPVTPSAAIVIQPDWSAILRTSQTQLTLQVVVNPPLRRGSAIHDAAWQSMHHLDAVDARFALWYPYPRLAVAEIRPPTGDHTHWDFSYMDPLVSDFFQSTKPRTSVLTISTIPQWMFETPASVAVPENPDEPVWDYEQGSKLRDDSLGEISSYYERVARWYLTGGFRDELGIQHISGHRYPVRYWEVLNEPEYEHALSPEYYTRIYDAVVSKLRHVSPQLRFVGMSLAEPSKSQHFFEYFLDPLHHAAGIPLDAISYHFYALGHSGETQQYMAASFFAQADRFLDSVGKIESIRMRLAPQTATQINEAGCIAANDVAKGADSMNGKDISSDYWNLCGAMFAYLYGNLATRGINILGASQLLGFPGQYPSVSLLDWKSGLPNPRYRVLQLLLRYCHPGDKLISGPKTYSGIYVQSSITRTGNKHILLVNKTLKDMNIVIPKASGGREDHVDVYSNSAPPSRSRLRSDTLTLHGFAVMIVTLPGRH